MRHIPMTVQNIYLHYHIPTNLQKHQIRVAHVCHEITKHWDGPSINQSQMIEAGLFHDMGNLIKFNFTNPSLLEGEDPQYWHKIQQDFIRQYGSQVHLATLTICQQIGLRPSVIQTIRLANWDDTPQLIATGNISVMILLYADMRVSPFGITSYQHRIADLQQRSPSNHHHQRLQYAQKLEQLLQSHTNTLLTSISDAGYDTFSRNITSYQIQTA